MTDGVAKIYEVVSGQILLSRRDDFFRLHSTVLLPIMQGIGIRPVLMLITEVGRYGRFLDIYEYSSLAEYQQLTDALLSDPRIPPYYREIGECVDGSITVELLRTLPYSAEWVTRGR